jgi:hypothetical protein
MPQVFPTAAAAAPVTPSTVVWSSDFASETAHDFKATATGTVGGVSATLVNGAAATQFEITASGLLVDTNTATGFYNTTLTAAYLTIDLADVTTFDLDKLYVARVILASGSPMPQVGNEGVFVALWEDSSPTLGEMVYAGMYYNNPNVVLRALKGGTPYSDRNASTIGLSAPRSIAACYLKGAGLALYSDDDESGIAFGGEGGFAFLQDGAGSSGMIAVHSTPMLDLSAATAQILIGVIGAVGGSQFIIQRIELHEIG